MDNANRHVNDHADDHAHPGPMTYVVIGIILGILGFTASWAAGVKIWLAPIVFVLFILGLLIVATGNTALAPFIYALF
jgi:sulfite exporter TauE/SafE